MSCVFNHEVHLLDLLYFDFKHVHAMKNITFSYFSIVFHR